jgi:HAD superfamily phosphatase (TIGR01668 family)
MPFSLLPTLVADAVTDISPEFLRSRDIRLLMLDFDNTIIPYTTNEPTPAVAAWLETVKASGISVCAVSNSRNDRVPVFCEKWGLDCILRSKKPFPVGIPKCLKKYGIPASRALMVGDQIFTDTLGGNLAGAQTLLVKPINNHNFWLKARHLLEQPFIILARKRSVHL